MASAEPAKESGVSRRELAVARSLDSARLRAESRLQRFLDAALELIEDGGPGKDFTVQEVVERSGQSLRLFYQYFGGKHELLLALFEESVRSTTEFLRTQIAGEKGALERLHRFVVEYYRLCRPGSDPAPVEWTPTGPMMVDFAQQLLTSHPTEAALAFFPLVSLFREVLEEAAQAQAIRPGLRHSTIAGMALEAIMFNAFSTTIGRSSRSDGTDPAEELWDLILHGVGATGPAPEKGRTATKDRRP
jgi:AcrR family transcriptional regulator